MDNLKEMAEILVCPKCQNKVLPSGDGKAFICRSCRLKYPICEDIPVMLIDSAEPLSDADAG